MIIRPRLSDYYNIPLNYDALHMQHKLKTVGQIYKNLPDRIPFEVMKILRS